MLASKRSATTPVVLYLDYTSSIYVKLNPECWLIPILPHHVILNAFLLIYRLFQPLYSLISLVRWLHSNTSSYSTEAVVLMYLVSSSSRYICSSCEAGSGGGGQGGGAESGPAPEACDGSVVSTAQLSWAHSRAEEADGGSSGSRYLSLSVSQLGRTDHQRYFECIFVARACLWTK